MGVTGLWRLIEPAGKPVPVETLENKVLAVDISIWLHQMVKGYQDAKGAPLPNAHLIGLFQRLCKLLYFRIKPVFVFDGGFPDLKRETIAKRQDNKTKYNSASEKLKREITLLLGKKTAIGSLLGKQISPTKNKQPQANDDIFKLPELPEKGAYSESESEDEQDSSASTVDLHSVDFDSDKFKNMPIKEKYDLLIELKETRKMNSWGKINTLPKKSDNFSDFQMQRLLKRRQLQECLEETEKEMGDEGMSLNELESLLNEEGIDTKIESLPSRRIASNNTTRYLLISNVRQALENAKRKEEAAQQAQMQISATTEVEKHDTKDIQKNDECDDDLEKAIKMSLECVEEADTSACTSKTDESWTSFLTESDYSDDEDEDGFAPPDMTSAKSYIKQYTDLNYKVIDNIVAAKQKEKNKPSKPRVNEIIEELAQEKTIIEDEIELMSSDDDKDKCEVVEKENDKDKSCAVEAVMENEVISKKCELEESNHEEASIICVEKSIADVISLDSSLGEAETDNDEVKVEPAKDNIKLESSSSSEDDFEDVSDEETESKKPVVTLTLNMGNTIEDDIFADIFESKAGEKCLAPNIKEEQEIKEDVSKHENEVKDIIKSNVTAEVETTSKSIETTSKNIETCLNEESEKQRNEDQKDVVDRDQTVSEELATTQKAVIPERQKISAEELNTMVTEIENEEQLLLQEKGKLDRIGRNITEQMTKEAQELLQIFGIPYIVAPMEAEAQCAVLEALKLTDGTITDDSDIWLFGGRTVYKNFFNQKKHVLQFLRERIEKSFNLSREKLVLLALLVGSDYTVGVTGVGPVTALEILASFPFNKKKTIAEDAKFTDYQEIVAGLQDFKKWVKAGRRTDNVSLKKKLKNVSLSDDFPSVRVVQAYFEPNVEKSSEKFSWGDPDITELREYARAKFGWSQHKLDEIIKPVIKRMQENKTQKTVHDYFKKKLVLDSLEDQMSKRVKAAIQKMGTEASGEELNAPEKPKPKRARKRSTNQDATKPGPSKEKRKRRNDETKQISEVIQAAPANDPDKTFDIAVPKTDRYQEIIPQRERDRKCILENKLKAIEVFRKSKIDPKKKTTKRRLPVPKEKADLSESSDTD
ncbi:mutagen-sensitive protein 201 [Danaus plexippus plexippus]|uniref:Mutagen-sensitive protein 201 n=1 Tax=Danaus plexippus plexippus TaxID=278856 RepID=A0A212F6C9_DANPL|nr:mutagen-sensitive protein 201 [Danaus plexippus plexippus]